MRRERPSYQFRKGQQNIFRTISAGRSNPFFEMITDILFGLSSYPSYISEIFLRRKFGERYFTTIPAIIISLIMLWIWYFENKLNQSFLGFTWLPFIIVILIQAIRRRREIKKFGTTYNFDRFSYSDGITHHLILSLHGREFYRVKIDAYMLYNIIEPAIPTIIGLILSIIPFTRGVGILIFFSGLSLAFRNFMKSHYARSIVLDEIDDLIVKADKHDALVEQKPKSETRGLSFPIAMPKSKEVREKISKSLDTDSKKMWNYEPTDDEKAA